MSNELWIYEKDQAPIEIPEPEHALVMQFQGTLESVNAVRDSFKDPRWQGKVMEFSGGTSLIATYGPPTATAWVATAGQFIVRREGEIDVNVVDSLDGYHQAYRVGKWDVTS